MTVVCGDVTHTSIDQLHVLHQKDFMSGYVVDMVEELKLRRWARLNHRRITEPDDSLHAVVLDELQTIRAEIASASTAEQSPPATDIAGSPPQHVQSKFGHDPETDINDERTTSESVHYV